MSEYRVSLGRKRDVVNLVTDGDFPSVGSFATNWGTSGVGWAFTAVGGGRARRTGAVALNFLIQPDVFELGKVYFVQIEVFNIAVTTGIFIGDYGDETIKVNGTFTTQRRCLSGTSLKVISGGVDIDNVQAFEMIYNDPLADEPKGLVDGSMTWERDKILNALFREYTNELVFWGDGYDFIKAEYDANGHRGTIDVLIEKRCQDGVSFETWFEGIIYLSDVSFDLRNCEATAVVEDLGAGQVLKNNRNEKLYFDVNTVFFGFRDFLVDTTVSIDFHDSSGAYPIVPPYADTGTVGTSLNIGLLLRHIIHGISGVNVEFDSDLFFTSSFKDTVLKWGAFIRSNSALVISSSDFQETQTLSFLELFTELNKIYNIEAFIEYDDNNVPTIKIEEKTDLQSAVNVLTLNDIANPSFRPFTEDFFKTVNIGYRRTFNTEEGGEQYVSSDDPSTETELILVSEFVQDSQIIEDLLAGTEKDAESIRNGNFDSDIEWIKGIGWTIAGGVAAHFPGTASFLGQFGVTESTCEQDSATNPSCRYEFTFEIKAYVAGAVRPQLGVNAGTSRAANGVFTEIIDSDSTEDSAGFLCDAAFDGQIDNVSVKLFKAKRDYDEDIFIVETDGSQTKKFGGGNDFNGNIEAEDNINRWIESLPNNLFKNRATEITITKTNTPILRLFEFEHPLTQAQWDLILINPIGKITFNSAEHDLPDTEGFIQRIIRQNSGGLTKFELSTP